MNKIILSGEDETNNFVIESDTEIIIRSDGIQRNISFILEEDTCLRVIELSKDSKNVITFDLKENSRLIYDKVSSNPNDKIEVNLNGNLSSLELRSSLISKTDSCCFFEIRHNAGKTTSYLSNHGVNNFTNKLDLIIDAYVPSSALECITNQENKIINTRGGKSTILPNLIIDTDQVVANHSAYIGNFDEDVIFYLKSRGIDSESAIKLLMNGFLIGNIVFDEKLENEIKEILKI